MWSSASSSGPYATKPLTPYVLRENFWNSMASGAGTLKVWGAGTGCWGADATSTDPMSASGVVKSYPDLARGWTIGTPGVPTNSGLPIQVQSLTKAKIRWQMTTSGNRYYALWDIYFHDTTMPGAGTAPVNLMIKQRVADTSGWEQNHESGGSSANMVTFGGITFRENLNTGLTSGSRAVIELFATPVNGNDMGIDDMTLDLKEVIDHYVMSGQIKTTDYLTSIQAGWEIVDGGTFVTTDFWTALQDEPDGN